jgi:hypothetical protein
VPPRQTKTPGDQSFEFESGERSVPYIVGWDSRKPGTHESALSGLQQTAKTVSEKTHQIATALQEAA